MSYVYKKKFMNLKIISLSERIQIKKEPIVLFHLYKIIEKVSSPKVIESKSAVVWGHKKQTYGSMEQNTESRNKPTHLQSIKEARIYNGKKTVSSASGVGKVGQPRVNQ